MNLKNFLKPIFLVLFFLISIFNEVKATHERGGQITYQKKSGSVNCYIITVDLYTYSGSPVNNDSIDIVWGDGSQGTIPRISKIDIGNENFKNTYSGEHCYNTAIPWTYIISVSDPNRAANIININNPNQGNPINPASQGIPFYIESSLSTVSYCDSLNNSPVFLDDLVDYAQTQQLFIHNTNAYETQGDSLSYELVPCMQGTGLDVPLYEFPDSVYDGDNDTFTIHPSTGQITWNTPQIAGMYCVAVKVTEWRRCGNSVFEVGNVVREMMIFVSGESTGIEKTLVNFSENISIYPNPLSKHAVVRITNAYKFANEKLELRIYDVLGKEVHHQALSTKHETLNLNLPSGIYFYKLTGSRQPIAGGKLVITD